ncbi:thiol-disulfide oxidoreductase DCC family protein [Tellurirhabdus rosea]|uniref:thiol-disulfide oxidoreductase DCC family protein n=1 Tax=Tellurirhabdus rosea TaxID=2674997 RepID=UPI00224D8423|nr:thiol-disulfide oxidoreductase DCC family protein [Tellurirhabdus rosea]
MPAILLFDGVCNLCNGAVNFIIDRDPAGHFRFAALQSEAGKALLRKHHFPDTHLDSLILVTDGRVLTRSDAALAVARGLSGGWPLLAVFRFLPRPLRDAVYDWVARNRYRWFGKEDTCRLPSPALKARFLE